MKPNLEPNAIYRGARELSLPQLGNDVTNAGWAQVLEEVGQGHMSCTRHALPADTRTSSAKYPGVFATLFANQKYSLVPLNTNVM